MSTTQQQLRELSTTVRILVDMLAESFHLDAQELRRRVEAELATHQRDAEQIPDPWTPVPPTAKLSLAGDPYRGEPRGEPMTTCAACNRTVPERLTVITVRGVICDVCAAQAR